MEDFEPTGMRPHPPAAEGIAGIADGQLDRQASCEQDLGLLLQPTEDAMIADTLLPMKSEAGTEV
eukprot:2880764-Alexandrium_andersonii.AAC.1